MLWMWFLEPSYRGIKEKTRKTAAKMKKPMVAKPQIGEAELGFLAELPW